MICAEVLVNGEPACTAGGDLTLVNLILSQNAGHHLRVSSMVDTTSDLAPNLRGALQTRIDKHHQWLFRNVQPGDEITIRIIDRPDSDAPVAPPAQPPACPADSN